MRLRRKNIMNNNVINEFYTKLAENSEFRTEISSLNLHNKKNLSEKKIKKIIEENILPWSKKLGYDFSAKDLLEFEKSQLVHAKEALTNEDLSDINGGVNWLALLMAGLTLSSSGNALEQTLSQNQQDMTSITNVAGSSAVLAAAPQATYENWQMETDVPNSDDKLNYHLPAVNEKANGNWQTETDVPNSDDKLTSHPSEVDEKTKQKNIQDTANFMPVEKISHDEFLKMVDGSSEVNATAAFIHKTLDKNNTWKLSADTIQEAIEQQAQEQPERELPENVRKSLEMLETLPRDEEGLRAYLTTEVDKFKDYFDEFTAAFGGDYKAAVDDYCARTPNDHNEFQKVARNLSRETLLNVKKELLLIFNKINSAILGKRGLLGGHWPKNDIQIQEEIDAIKNVDEKERYLDEKLEKFIEHIPAYDRARGIHDWVTENVAYNYIFLELKKCEGRFYNHPEYVFKSLNGVCRGYAWLTELMMRLAKIPCAYTGLKGHAINAIFINGEWFLIDTTWDAYKQVNQYLVNNIANYELDPQYNVVTDGWKKGRTHQYFPDIADNALAYNQRFIETSKYHEVAGADYRFNGENGVCEINLKPMVNWKGKIKTTVWDITKECIVDGELMLPETIATRVEYLMTDDERVLSSIRRLHIPRNAEVGSKLYTRLKNIDNVTVDPANPYYGMSEGLIWNKNNGEVLHLPKNRLIIPNDCNAKLTVNDLSNISEATVDPNNPDYGGAPGLIYSKKTGEILWQSSEKIYSGGSEQGIIWNKNTGEVLWVPKDKVHIPTNFNGIFTQEQLRDVKEVTVDPDNPFYIMYTPKLYGKPGIYRRNEYLFPWAKPLREQNT